MTPARFRPSRLDNIEYLEDYRPGGFLPVSIGDVLAQGRYRVVHKLGFGGASTIWLGRNQAGELVTMKLIGAEASSKYADEIPELAVPQKLSEYVQANPPLAPPNIQTLKDHFKENGPSGSHLCLVYDLCGPSILSMSDSPGRVAGNRRLRSDLARKVAMQVASVVKLMHTAGYVHGGSWSLSRKRAGLSLQNIYFSDLTISNILFRIAENVKSWSDSEVYLNFGHPETETMATRDHSPLGIHVPAHLVAPIDNALLTNPNLLQEEIVVIDFGQSFCISRLPTDYEPATVPHYLSPEARFEGNIGAPSDIWALGCTIFEIRAGFPIFETFFGGDDEVLMQTVATLGKLPLPWWNAFENRHLWFDEQGIPKTEELQKVLLHTEKTSIIQKLASIGTDDVPPVTGDDGPMMESRGTRLDECEIELLGDLLQKMLRYRPQDRISITDVISHPWFTFK